MIDFFKNIFRYFRQLVMRHYVLNTNPLIINDNAILIIAPHPDDETFGCAGLIAKKTALNADVSIAFLTYGENSIEYLENNEVAENRQKTAQLVCKKMDVHDLHYCGFTDGHISRRGDEKYDNDVKTVAKLIEKINPKEIYCTHPLEGWSDHTAAAEITSDALKLLNSNISLYYYWVWVWFSVPLNKVKLLNFDSTFYLNITDVIKQKKSAILTYLSSVNSQGDAYCGNLPKMFLKAFEWPYEVFEKVEYK